MAFGVVVTTWLYVGYTFWVVIAVYNFYRAACNADAVQRGEFCPSVRPSVCLSVRPSVTRVIPDKTEERSVQISTPYERTFILVF